MNSKVNYKKMNCSECMEGAGLDFAFTMAYQPIFDLDNKNIFAHEALVRGINNESAYSILSKVNDENRYRFDQACRVKAIELASRLSMKTFLSINFLPNAIYNPETCIKTTMEASEKYSFSKDRIIFEVTEGEKVENHAHLIDIIKEYKKQGIKTAIDDFGAGYSGLNLLAEFQPDYLKIDMALVRGIDKDRIRRSIIQGILYVCQEIKIKVIAEGIETKEEFMVLRDLGIQYLQGYYFSKPVFEGLGNYLFS
ncbi:MAG: EAL domain-containing protein [Leptospiraceae bacterium]|nr:EAL domain-containing protein [Leptospiraceae bacterium]